MISPDRYNMAAAMAIGEQIGSRPHLLTEEDGVLDLPRPDRLEVALDNALLLKAMGDGARLGAGGLLPPGGRTMVWMSTRDYCMGDRTKHGVRVLFEEDVRERYATAGWSDMSIDWDYPQSQEMVFRFKVAITDPVARQEVIVLDELRDMVLSVAEPLGVTVGRADGWFVTAVDDMRLAAKCMRFDLDMSFADPPGHGL